MTKLEELIRAYQLEDIAEPFDYECWNSDSDHDNSCREEGLVGLGVSCDCGMSTVVDLEGLKELYLWLGEMLQESKTAPNNKYKFIVLNEDDNPNETKVMHGEEKGDVIYIKPANIYYQYDGEMWKVIKKKDLFKIQTLTSKGNE